MQTICNYHPTRSAHFICYQCGTAFCHDCVSKRSHDHYGTMVNHYFCPKCNVEAQGLGVGNIVPPFWKRLPAFFLYPLKLQPLLFILFMAGLNFLWADSALVTFILSAAMLKYSFVVLRNTAKGSLSAPVITLATLNEELELVFKQILIIVVVFASFGFVIAGSGPVAGALFWMVAILCLPAMIMSLAATNRLVHALNPLVFFGIIFRIGGGYFLMYVFLLFLLAAPAALVSQIGIVLPLPLTLFLYFAAKNYYMVMSYNLMGYALLQYHQEIGYEVDYEAFVGQDPSTRTNPGDSMLNEAEILVKDGKIDEAIAVIGERVKGEFTDLRLAERYYNLLKLKGDSEASQKHARTYLTLLVKEDKKEKACNLYRECVTADATFSAPPDTALKLAEWLAWRKDPQDTLNLLIKFSKSYPEHPLLPDVYFFLAKFLHTRMDNRVKAKEVLDFIARKFPTHEIAGSAARYLQQIV